MEQAVRACCKGIKIGKILIHRAACDMDSLETPPMGERGVVVHGLDDE